MLHSTFFIAKSWTLFRNIQNDQCYCCLDVKFQVFIHGKDIVEDVIGDPRNNTHVVGIMELSLIKQKKRQRLQPWWKLKSNKYVDTAGCPLPPWCGFCQRMFVHMQRWYHCIHPAHLSEKGQNIQILLMFLSIQVISLFMLKIWLCTVLIYGIPKLSY